ncbi:KxYKxGKxW signal peptide domain-containing protein, partial [Floricoccus penangensis]|uniref:KxYKxGKxW signal peptide domain-containing protein n=1 Tax=Floricoccus penangensis TaxID=1859475 RepID=UPI0011812976
MNKRNTNEDSRNKMSFRSWKSGKQWLYAGAAIFIGVVAPLGTSYIVGLNSGAIVAHAAVLEGSLFQNSSLNNSSGTTPNGPKYKAGVDGDKAVNFTISGSGVADVSAIASGKKQAVIKIPTGIQGNITPGAQADVNAAFSLKLKEVPLLGTAVTGLQTALDTATSAVAAALNVAGSVGGVKTNFQETSDAINALLNDAITFDEADFKENIQMSADGTYMYVTLDDGLGKILQKKLSDVLDNIYNLIGNLKAEPIPYDGIGSTLINTERKAAAGVFNAGVATITGPLRLAVTSLKTVVNGTGAIVNQLADAAVLGSTKVTFPTTIHTDTVKQADVPTDGAFDFAGGIIKNDVINVPVFTNNTDKTTIYFDITPPTTSSSSTEESTGTTGTSTGASSSTPAESTGTSTGTSSSTPGESTGTSTGTSSSTPGESTGTSTGTSSSTPASTTGTSTGTSSSTPAESTRTSTG